MVEGAGLENRYTPLGYRGFESRSLRHWNTDEIPMDTADVIIIGGGIAGASAALHLAEHGRSVTLLERGAIASEASGVNAGGIGALGWGNVPDLESYLTMGSLQIFKRLQLELGYDIEFRASGGLQTIQTDGQYEFARDRVLSLKSRGYVAELLTVNEARAIEPELSPELKGAMYFSLRGQADPVKATCSFADAARNRGASILTEQEVHGIRQSADGTYEVVCHEAAFHARNLVLAAGAWCVPLGKMLGVSIPVVPVRGQMWATEPLPPRVFHGLSGAESYAYWSGDPGAGPDAPPELTHRGDRRITRHLYGRQTRDGEVIFGGDRQSVGYDRAVDATGVEANFAHSAEVLPFLNDVAISRTWSGLMPFSLDGKPIIGKIAQAENLYIVTGLASSGFGRGPMAGKLIADYLHTGHRPHVLAESDPDRCVTPLS